VALFEHADVVGETSGASEWLRQAHQMDPDNVYVLWKRILSRGNSWFPDDLVHDPDTYKDELWLVARLLDKNPNDSLALGLERLLNETGKSLYSQINIKFFNSLRWLAPDPMKQIGLIGMLELPKGPVKASKPNLAYESN